MTGHEVRDWLDEELKLFPERASGEELERYLVQRTRNLAESDRGALAGGLGEWLQLRSEPQTMLALALAVEHQLDELRSEISRLLDDVEAGEAFNPALRDYYRKRISEALNAIQ